jgi:hypothetical protein
MIGHVSRIRNWHGVMGIAIWKRRIRAGRRERQAGRKE